MNDAAHPFYENRGLVKGGRRSTIATFVLEFTGHVIFKVAYEVFEETFIPGYIDTFKV
jgi:hypothetical protein